MTQKQMVAAVVGIALTFSAFVFVSHQLGEKEAMQEMRVSQDTPKMAAPVEREQVMVPVPDTIDGIASSIQAESSAELSAMDEEEQGSLEELNQDSDSVNNLGTSYDENSL